MKIFSISKYKSANENVYTEKLEAELSEAFLDLKEFIELSELIISRFLNRKVKIKSSGKSLRRQTELMHF